MKGVRRVMVRQASLAFWNQKRWWDFRKFALPLTRHTWFEPTSDRLLFENPIVSSAGHTYPPA